MEVPSEVLQKLVCERCSGYLSRGPIHLVENTKYRCGRCPWTEDDEDEGIRVEAYEELAKLVCFPCRYQKNGCTSKVLFTDNERHEQACPYRERLCPIAEWGRCGWTGLQTGILKHCQQYHHMKVVENPCKITYDITRPSWDNWHNYILFAFEVLFLIQSKVCTASQKIYHAVRLIDDPTRASNFNYKLDIQNNGRVISIPGDVLPRERLVLQEDTSVVTGINCLLEMLGDFKNTTFTVTIECSGQGTSSSDIPHQVTPPVKTLNVQFWCDKCFTERVPVYRGSLNAKMECLCRDYAPEQRVCKNSIRGCTYSDIDMKCEKHELYCCQHSTECSICSEDITGTTLDFHYRQAHGGITHRAGTVCTVIPTVDFKQLILTCEFGKAVCEYTMYNDYFQLWVQSPLPRAQLHNYRCLVQLSRPDTGHILYSKVDWFTRIPQLYYNKSVHDHKVNIKVNIIKIKDQS